MCRKGLVSDNLKLPQYGKEFPDEILENSTYAPETSQSKSWNLLFGTAGSAEALEKQSKHRRRKRRESRDCGALNYRSKVSPVWCSSSPTPLQTHLLAPQRIFGGYVLKGVTPSNLTKARPIHEHFPGGNWNQSSMCIALVFPRINTRIHKNGRNS